MLSLLFLTFFSLQDPHHAANARGAAVMGFDLDKTVHHFLLYDNGGAIAVAVRDRADARNREAIRAHLPHLAMMFGRGRFDAPMLVHESAAVPGTAVMAARKDRIAYRYVETAAGGRVDIVTDEEALAAVHAFLAYQIVEHKTGDPLKPSRRR